NLALGILLHGPRAVEHQHDLGTGRCLSARAAATTVNEARDEEQHRPPHGTSEGPSIVVTRAATIKQIGVALVCWALPDRLTGSRSPTYRPFRGTCTSRRRSRPR